MRAVTMQAAARLSADGIEVEIIDLRTLRPWDVETCVRSIEKTGRAAVVYEANRTGGFGAEITAELAERCFASLDAPVSRIASPDVPAMPFSASLEHAFMLNPDKVADGLRRGGPCRKETPPAQRKGGRGGEKQGAFPLPFRWGLGSHP